MSWWMCVGMTWGRALVVGCLAAWLGCQIARLWMHESTRRRRGLCMILAAAPLMGPSLLVGYAWAGFSLSLIRQPFLNELFYCLLLVVRLSVMGALVYALAPSPRLSREAWWLAKMARGQGRGGAVGCVPSKLTYLIEGPGRLSVGAVACVMVLSFVEFDLASLMGIDAWPVRLFDAQAGGLELSESMKMVGGPLLMQVGVLAVAVWVVLGAGASKGAEGMLADGRRDDLPELGPMMRRCVWGILCGGVLLTWVIPGVILLDQVLAGGLGEGLSLLGGFNMWAEVGAGFVFAATATAGSLLMLWMLRRKASRVVTLAFCVPGLAGGLIIGLVLQFAFQSDLLASAYDTPVPLVVALVCLLMPVAVLLGSVLLGARKGKAGARFYLAELLCASDVSMQRVTGRRVVWLLRGRARMGLAFILFYWIYFEVLASALLRPTGMTPATVRLYDLTHYGNSGALGAMMLITGAAPIVAGAVMLAGRGGLQSVMESRGVHRGHNKRSHRG